MRAEELALRPAQHGFPGRGGLVQATQGGEGGRLVEGLRILLGLLGDGEHGVAEGVQLVLALAFRRLDHERARNDQREAIAAVFESDSGKTWLGSGSRVYQIVAPDV